MVKRIAIIDKNKCHPNECGNYLCAKLCPVNRAGADCITAHPIHTKAVIDEFLCTGCGICPQRCPFGAIQIINLPEQLQQDPVYRYGENEFELFSLPTPVFGKVTGILGKNGIGKTTSLKIIAGQVQANLGKWQNPPDFKQVISHFKGTELQRYLDKLDRKEVTLSYKPQQVDLIPKQFKGTVRELLSKIDSKRLEDMSKELQLSGFMDNDISTISGGELQRVAIAAAVLKKANILLFDEPSSYLDIRQRVHISSFIRSLAKEDISVMVIEHDLIILDFMAELLNIMYGQEAAYGIVSGIKSTREGINAYLEGYLKEENVRFRSYPIKFGVSQEKGKGKPIPLTSWSAISKKLGNFELQSDAGMLHKNEVVGILGENGIGKTSFIKILAGMLEPDSGSIDTKVKVSYKPQYLETSSDLLVVEFLKEAINKYSAQLITPLDIERLMTKRLSELSGGELQRVAIVHCLSQDAQLFLLDEPSAYLDVEQRLLICKVIKNSTFERDISVLVIDHDLMFLDSISDRLIVFSGEPSRRGLLQGPYSLEEGMNKFLQLLNITLRKDHNSQRPRINNVDSVKDREQKAQGTWYCA